VSDESSFVAAGQEQGEIIAAYLIKRMKEERLTPAEGVNVVATHIEEQAEAMLAAGTGRDQVLEWLKGLRQIVAARISEFTERQH
jgi:hypothetical protein